VTTALNEVSPEYLSFAIDLSQVVGGKWWNPDADRVETGSGTHDAPVFDFDRPRLDRLTAALAPAYLRLGGSESDKIYYHLSPGGDPEAVPPGYESVLTREQWDAVCGFARRVGVELVFTLNAGPGARDASGAWDPENAIELLDDTVERGCPVSLWELGNELNAFWYIHGVANHVSTERYARDLATAKRVIEARHPEARLAGQGSAFWPIVGEPLSLFFGFTAGYLEGAGHLVDVITWHYYPQQSRRGPAATRRATPGRLLDPDHLDEAGYWAEVVRGLRDVHSPGSELWLGEVGNAQYGGEPGVSDVFVGSLWWLDQLGLMAVHGHDVVVRQTLAGSDYGMIDDATLEPRPDYWSSVLWKRLMGRRVYAAEIQDDGAQDDGAHEDGDGKLRVYAHSGPAAADGDDGDGGDGSVTVLVINLDHRRNAEVSFPDFAGTPYRLYEVRAPDVLGGELMLDGRVLEPAADGTVPEIAGRGVAISGTPAVRVHPLSYSFVVFTP
jgi:heparanase 1